MRKFNEVVVGTSLFWYSAFGEMGLTKVEKIDPGVLFDKIHTNQGVFTNFKTTECVKIETQNITLYSDPDALVEDLKHRIDDMNDQITQILMLGGKL